MIYSQKKNLKNKEINKKTIENLKKLQKNIL